MAAVLRTIEGARDGRPGLVGRVPQGDQGGVPAARLKPRQRVRALPVPDFGERLARAQLVAWMKDDQLRLNVTQDEYAAHLGVSPSTLSRFRVGTGKLSRQMRRRLLVLQPRWRRTLDAVVLEDTHQDDEDARTG